jgi:acetoin utilization protein AcuB
MKKSIPPVQKFMTYLPHSIAWHETVEEAQSMMSKLNIRHLPVMKSGELFGIISDRDIKMVLSIVSEAPRTLLIKDLCHEHPYQVSPDAPLDQVALEMAEKRYGSAIVVENKKVVGIFTTVDACRALATIIETRSHGK